MTSKRNISEHHPSEPLDALDPGPGNDVSQNGRQVHRAVKEGLLKPEQMTPRTDDPKSAREAAHETSAHSEEEPRIKQKPDTHAKADPHIPGDIAYQKDGDPYGTRRSGPAGSERTPVNLQADKQKDQKKAS